ncbi:MAG: type II toxin-antitoxin system VapC family toxin [Actinomycetota bacterium]|nr:type II toxin-antitoxin system VapC family toxin [Actinomycetota bacterium]
MKRMLSEADSPDVEDVLHVLADLGMSLATSRIAHVEVARTLRSVMPGTDLADLLAGVWHDVDTLEVGRDVLRLASGVPVVHLRALDAIHVASALLCEATVVVTRDRRMARACSDLGLAVA